MHGPSSHEPPATTAPGHARATRQRARYRPVRSPLVSMGPSLEEERRRRRTARNTAVASVVAATAIALLVWSIALLGREVVADGRGAAPRPTPATLPAGPPLPEHLAAALVSEDGAGGEEDITLSVPIRREATTAVGYYRREDPGVLDLEPEGTRANLAWGRRMLGRFLSTRQGSDLTWLRLGSGPPNVVLVGAAPGTDVYAPLDARVIAISDLVIDGQAEGAVVQLQPLGDGETVVVMRQIDAAPDLAVGQTLGAGMSLVGYVHDLHGRIEHPLSSYTHDDGSGVEVYVRRTELATTPE